MTTYLSRLTSDLDGGSLVALCAIAWAVGIGLLAALICFGWPPVWQWTKRQHTRARLAVKLWWAAQEKRANEPQDFPPAAEPFPWAPVLVTLAVVGLAALVVLRCGGIRCGGVR